MEYGAFINSWGSGRLQIHRHRDARKESPAKQRVASAAVALTVALTVALRVSSGAEVQSIELPMMEGRHCEWGGCSHRCSEKSESDFPAQGGNQSGGWNG
jgi:hypothetical protein